MFLKKYFTKIKNIQKLILSERAAERIKNDREHLRDRRRLQKLHFKNIQKIESENQIKINKMRFDLEKRFAEVIREKNKIIEEQEKEVKHARKAWKFLRTIGMWIGSNSDGMELLNKFISIRNAENTAQINKMKDEIDRMGRYINKHADTIDDLLHDKHESKTIINSEEIPISGLIKNDN